MLYHLFEYIEQHYHMPGAGLFQYISFRAGMAIIVSLIISLILGERIIRYLKRLQIGESIRDLGLEGQKEKEGTPTMGGLIIAGAIVIPCLLFAKLNNIYIQLMLICTVWMTIIGFVDDYIKVFRKNKKGLHGKFKVLGQVSLGLVIGATMMFHKDITVRMSPSQAAQLGYPVMSTYADKDGVEFARTHAHVTNFPFLKKNNLDYGKIVGFFGFSKEWVWVLFIPLVILIVTSVSNAANLTDGLDGLATGVSAIIGATLAILAYVSGNTIFADYLNILYIPFSEELVIYASCFVGACIGFLWYNSFPAKIFMGDTGSLMIGGSIAALAILIRKELLIPLLCGIFVIENLSVVLQVSYFKYTRKKYGEGRRIFKMSPIHHHFQKEGMHEAKIAVRFWIVGILLAILTIITLKIR